MNILVTSKLSKGNHIAMAKIEANYFEHELIADYETTIKWHDSNEDSCIIALDKDTGLIAGHMSFVPVDNYFYDLMLKGNFVDTQITSEHIIQYKHPGIFKLYFCVVCVAPSYRGKNISRIILKEYARRFLELKERGIIFSDIVADAITEEGRRFCQNVLGMSFVGGSKHQSKIMHVGANIFYEKLKNNLL